MGRVVQFPVARSRPRRATGERVVSETVLVLVSARSDGSARLTSLRTPRFLDPRRACTPTGPDDGARSLLLYKFAPGPPEIPTRATGTGTGTGTGNAGRE